MNRISSMVVAAVVATTMLLAGCGAAQAPRPAPATTTTTPRTMQNIAPPKEISIPRIDATSELIELGLNTDQTVQVPPVDAPMQAGWFTGAPRPGAPGPAVILGHVNGGGRAGIFARLHELAEGDEVFVSRTDATTARFTVTRVDQVSKKHFPTNEVYGDTRGPELRLITCGGTFDHSADSYRDNVIIYATLTG